MKNIICLSIKYCLLNWKAQVLLQVKWNFDHVILKTNIWGWLWNFCKKRRWRQCQEKNREIDRRKNENWNKFKNRKNFRLAAIQNETLGILRPPQKLMYTTKLEQSKLSKQTGQIYDQPYWLKGTQKHRNDFRYQRVSHCLICNSGPVKPHER